MSRAAVPTTLIPCGVGEAPKSRIPKGSPSVGSEFSKFCGVAAWAEIVF